MKKTNKWISFDFGSEDKLANPIDLTNDDDDFDLSYGKRKIFNLIKNLEPHSVADLAVHPKKIKEVESWIEQNVVANSNNHHASLLLLTGPTGSGKTTTVNVLCKRLNIGISEWITPSDKSSVNLEYFAPSQSARFWEFVSQSKYPSLFDTCIKKIMLVKDFPNSVIRNPVEFFDILEKCYCTRQLAIIFICTDSNTSNLNLSQTLFPQNIREKYNVDHISFNPVSATLLKETLKRGTAIVKKHSDVCKVPSPTIIDAIISSSVGDVRCAVNQFYFASLKGTTELPVELTKNDKEKVGSKRKKISKNATVKSMSKDEILGLFHSLGRVLNPKKKQIENSWRLQCDLDRLIDEFSTQPTTFSAFLFENYHKYFGDINDLAKAADMLSLSQIFLDKWVDHHDVLIFALWISVMGVMVYNEHRVSKWNQIKGPVKVNKIVNNNFEVRFLSSVDLCFYNKIAKTQQFPTLNFTR